MIFNIFKKEKKEELIVCDIYKDFNKEQLSILKIKEYKKSKKQIIKEIKFCYDLDVDENTFDLIRIVFEYENENLIKIENDELYFNILIDKILNIASEEEKIMICKSPFTKISSLYQLEKDERWFVKLSASKNIKLRILI